MPLDPQCGITVQVAGGRFQGLMPQRIWVVVHRRRVPRQDRLYTLRQQTERALARIDAIRALGGLSELSAEEKQQRTEVGEERARVESLGSILTLTLPPVCIIPTDSINRIRALPTMGNPRFEDHPDRLIPLEDLLNGLGDHMTLEDHTRLLAEILQGTPIHTANWRHVEEVLNRIKDMLISREVLRHAPAAAPLDAAEAAIAAADLPEEAEPVGAIGVGLEERQAFQAHLRRLESERRTIANLRIAFVAIVIGALAVISESMQRNFF